jgi:hypothetical protein
VHVGWYALHEPAHLDVCLHQQLHSRFDGEFHYLDMTGTTG